MKTTLLWAFTALFSISLWAQAPTIEGDTMLCPEGFGTATVVTGQAYDSYQWQWRFSFSSNEFQDVPGADEASFTYDHYNYSVTDIRVKVTLDGTTYYSNELFVDGYAFSSIFTIQTFNENEVTINPNDGSLMLCQGASILMEVGMPYNTNVQWFKSGAEIAGANSTTYTISGEGEYYVTASPQVCPDFSQTSLPVIVTIDPNCNLSVGNPGAGVTFGISPNPVKSDLVFSSNSNISKVQVFDVSGKKLLEAEPNTVSGRVEMGTLSSGVYVIHVDSDKGSKSFKFVKE